MILRKIERERKKLQKMLDEIKSYYASVDSIIKRIDDSYRNGRILLLEDLTENVVSKLVEFAQDDRTIILFSKDGHKIVIAEKEAEKLPKRKNLF